MEHRAAARRRLFKAGTIAVGTSQIDCIVKNLSEVGAGLETTTPLYIPDQFTLLIPSDRLERNCRVVWRKNRRIGVAFDAAKPRPTLTPLKHFTN